MLGDGRLRTCSDSSVEKRRTISYDPMEPSIDSQRRRGARISDKYIREAERLMGSSSLDISAESEGNSSSRSDLLSNLGSDRPGEQTITWSRYMKTLIREEIVVLIFLRFLAMFCQTSMEAVIPALMDIYFLYDDMANSYLYLAAGLELLVMFFLLSLASRYVSDRSLVLSGTLVLLLSLLWHAVTIPSFSHGDRSNAAYFGVGIFLELIGIPTVCDIGLALYSKLLPDEMQGFCHGVRRFVSQVGILLGPLWGACTLPRPILLTAVPVAMAAVALFIFCASYKKMRPVGVADSSLPDSEEQRPLLE